VVEGSPFEDLSRIRPGTMVLEVLPGTPADQAGLDKGDLILSVDGMELGNDYPLSEAIAAFEPGDIITLEIQSPGEDEPTQVSVELGEHPDEEGKAYLGIRYSTLPHFRFRFERGRFDHEFDFDFDFPQEGFEIPELPHFEEFFKGEDGFEFPDGETIQGVVIMEVLEGSPADEAGLKEKDVITALDGEPVEGTEAFAEQIASIEPGDETTLTVQRKDEELEITVPLGEHPEVEGRGYLGVKVGLYIRVKVSGEHFPEGWQPPFLHFEDYPWGPASVPGSGDA
jgi:PDZ domain-containing secreted protein